jgi:uncharacterized protein
MAFDSWLSPSPARRGVSLADSEATLDVDECLEKLREQWFGRVVFTEGALPAITAVRYAVVGRDIVFSVEGNAGISKALRGAVVAFEADCCNDKSDGWCVAITGIAIPCDVPSQWPRVAAADVVKPGWRLADAFLLGPGLISGQVLPRRARDLR